MSARRRAIELRPAPGGARREGSLALGFPSAAKKFDMGSEFFLSNADL
ncbi:hypothetical protein [Sorangium sp. So ce542]